MLPVLEDDGRAGEALDGLEDLGRAGLGHPELGEHLVDPLGLPQLLQLLVDDQLADRLADLGEAHLAVEGHQRQAQPVARLHQRGGQRAPPAAQLDDESGGVAAVEALGEGGQLGGPVRQGDPGAQHQVSAAQQGGDVGQLGRVHPAHRPVEPGGPGDDLGIGDAQRPDLQDLRDRHGQGGGGCGRRGVRTDDVVGDGGRGPTCGRLRQIGAHVTPFTRGVPCNRSTIDVVNGVD